MASFKNADMVMHVLDDKGQPAYVAIEASFTVDSNDVSRDGEKRWISYTVHRIPWFSCRSWRRRDA